MKSARRVRAARRGGACGVGGVGWGGAAACAGKREKRGGCVRGVRAYSEKREKAKNDDELKKLIRKTMRL